MTDSAASPKVSSPPRLLRSSLVVGAMTMISRVLGLLRDVVFARMLGADAAADAFFVAFKIPNFLRRLFAEGAFAQAFVPVLSEYRQNGSLAAVQQLVNRVCGCLGFTLLVLTGLAVIGAPVITAIFAPGFMADTVKFDLTTDMIRITFPYLLLISLTGFAGSILNSYDRFAIPAVTPVLLNICLIGAALIAAPWFEQPVLALAWGVLVAGVVQLLFQVPFLWQLQLLPRPQLDWQDQGVRRILGLMLPALFGVSVSQINLLLDTVLASLLPDGSVSWLYYSDRLTELPLGVFGIAVATVILPNLSRQHASASGAAFAATLDWALRMIVLIAVPAALALMVLAKPILVTLFFYGKTNANDVAMSVFSLQAYAIGLLAFMLIKVLAPGFYARQDMKTPVRIGVIAMVSNMVLNIILVVPFHYLWHIGHVGLALATSLAAFLNAGMLFSQLRRQGIFQPRAGWFRFVLQLLAANGLMVAVLLGLGSVWSDWMAYVWWERVGYLALVCGAGALVYAGGLLAAGVRIGDLRMQRAAA